MNAEQRRRRLIIAMLVIGIIIAVLSVRSTLRQSEDLRQRQAEALDFNQKIAEIQQLADVRPVAALEFEPPDQIGRRVSAAMSAASIPESTMRSTTPMLPARIGQTAYQARRTTVRLEAITTKQMLDFCDAIVAGAEGLTVSDLRMSDPTDARNGSLEQWDVELTLTQMSYSPIAERPRR